MKDWECQEVYVSPRVCSLYVRLKSLLELNQSEFHNQDVEKLVNGWSLSLLRLDGVVKETEDKQQLAKVGNSCKIWLTHLQITLYDLENTVDLLEIWIRSQQMQQHNNNDDGNMYESIFSSSITSKLEKFASNHPLEKSTPVQFTGNTIIQEGNVCTNGSIQVIEALRMTINVYEGSHTSNDGKKKRKDSLSSPLLPVCGREDDVEKIINSFKEDANPSVTCIIGAGGIGKTTVAQAVFNHGNLRDFKIKAWVCVTQKWDDLSITTSIYNSASGSNTQFHNPDEAHKKLEGLLRGQRYLIVLDDVWITDYEDWRPLRPLLSVGAKGSKALVTTREENTATLIVPCEDHHHKLGSLEDDMIWKIYQNESERIAQECIKKTIIEKCKGLPLVAVVIGGMRRTINDDQKWKQILESQEWGEKNDIRDILKMSFDHLRRELKPCFAYCSFVQKGKFFEKQTIIQMWMAEGLLLAKHGKEIEEVGEDYFNELVSASLIQLSNNSFYFRIHDLIIDLARSVAGAAYFRGDDSKVISERTHHLHLSCEYQEEFNKLQNIDNATHLCTFSYTVRHGLAGVPKILYEICLEKLRNVRVLCAPNFRPPLGKLGEWKHLRFLHLPNSNFPYLPLSITGLVNLQTLLMQHSELVELPGHLWDLVNLRHVDFSGSIRLRKMAKGVGKLTELRTFPTTIWLGGSDGCTSQDIKELKKLSGTLSIDIESTCDMMGMSESILSNKSNLQSIWLTFQSFTKAEEGERVLNVLQPPHEKLSRFILQNYPGKKFPPWDFCQFQCLADVKLRICIYCESLPPLGSLPKLQELSIECLYQLRDVNPEFYGEDGFPALESLSFECMIRLTNFRNPSSEEKNCFPKLQRLTISDCPMLAEFSPGKLPCLRELSVDECPKSEVSLANWPLLMKLDISSCKAVISTEPAMYYQLETLRLDDVEELVSLDNIVPLQGLNNLPRNLRHLTIEKCKIGAPLEGWVLHLPPSLTTLEIKSIGNLTSLEPSTRLDKLTFIYIDNCPELRIFYLGEKEAWPLLQLLELINCPELTFAGEGGIERWPLLEQFHVCGCPKLEQQCRSSPFQERIMRIPDVLWEP